MSALEPRVHHHTVVCPAEAGLHPAIRTLVRVRHGYSVEPRPEIAHSGTFSLYRNTPLGMVGTAGEMLREEGIIPRNAPYLPRLEAFAARYLDSAGGLHRTRRTEAEVREAVKLMDEILDDVHPGHRAFAEHFQYIEKTHEVVQTPWAI